MSKSPTYVFSTSGQRWTSEDHQEATTASQGNTEISVTFCIAWLCFCSDVTFTMLSVFRSKNCVKLNYALCVERAFIAAWQMRPLEWHYQIVQEQNLRYSKTWLVLRSVTFFRSVTGSRAARVVSGELWHVCLPFRRTCNWCSKKNSAGRMRHEKLWHVPKDASVRWTANWTKPEPLWNRWIATEPVAHLSVTCVFAFREPFLGQKQTAW